MSTNHSDEKYTDPELRHQIKEELMNSDKGGEPGQWSARKSQMLVREYEKRGGGYKTSEKDEAAKSLEEWTEQDWQTEDGSDRAREGDITKRYLPKAVWDQLSDREKAEAERTKEEASKHGEQHVELPPAAKKAMHDYEHDSEDDRSVTKEELYEQAKALHIEGRSKMNREELLSAIEQAKSTKH